MGNALKTIVIHQKFGNHQKVKRFFVTPGDRVDRKLSSTSWRFLNSRTEQQSRESCLLRDLVQHVAYILHNLCHPLFIGGYSAADKKREALKVELLALKLVFGHELAEDGELPSTNFRWGEIE